MNKQALNKLKTSLATSIEACLDAAAEDTTMQLPYLGRQTALFMAEAALAVLESADDIHQSLVDDGEIREGL